MNTIPFQYDEVRAKGLLWPLRNPIHNNNCGNNAYETINGYALLVTKADGTPLPATFRSV
jgi:hypothetical protein